MIPRTPRVTRTYTLCPSTTLFRSFNDSGFKLDFGIRSSIRSASNINFNMVAPVYAGNGASDPNGCLVRWKAADVVRSEEHTSELQSLMRISYAVFCLIPKTKKAEPPLIIIMYQYRCLSCT